MKISLVLLALVFTFSSCKKEVTEIQQVDQAFSAVYTLNAAGWGSSDGGLSYSTDLPVAELNNDILTNGAVLVYLSFDNGATYEAIPEVFNGVAYGSVHTQGKITLDLYATDGGTVTPPGAAILAKVVLISAEPL